MEGSKRCKRLGCTQDFLDSENHPSACHYHLGPVIFHDTKKGYSCCNQIVYDWDDFAKIVGCQVGPHSSEAQQTNFFKSDTVGAAERSLNQPDGVVVKSIDDLEREIAERERKQAEERRNQPEEYVIRDGFYVCANFGCNKKYKEEENVEGCCEHHTQGPGFHDVRKFWPCCKKEAWDWDDFMKILPCAVGMHKPKVKK